MDYQVAFNLMFPSKIETSVGDQYPETACFQDRELGWGGIGLSIHCTGSPLTLLCHRVCCDMIYIVAGWHDPQPKSAKEPFLGVYTHNC